MNIHTIKMKNRGQIITHGVLTVAGIVAAALTTYYANIIATHDAIGDVKASIATLQATEDGQAGDIQNLEVSSQQTQQDIIMLTGHFGLQVINTTK